jgi:hypothetical protein
MINKTTTPTNISSSRDIPTKRPETVTWQGLPVDEPPRGAVSRYEVT